jgi:anti-anti-sigma factor
VTTDGGRLAGFGVTVGFADERALLSVRGGVDVRTASELGAFFDAVIASGYSSVTLDFSELDFIDASGLAVVAIALHRLAAAGGELTIRSPSLAVGRILDTSGLADLVQLEPPDSTPFSSREALVAAPKLSGTFRPDDWSEQLRMGGGVPASDEVVDGALRLLVSLALATVGGADGASVSLQRHGRLTTVAASDQTVLDMDAGQYATGQGPCVDASLVGRGFHVESLDTESRWPAFTPRAQALGISAILSSPLLARNRPVGALNIYSLSGSAFAAKDQSVASMLATEASIFLTDAGVDVTDDQLTRRFQRSLRTRQIIDRAEGVIMERDGVTEDEAFTSLRRASLRTSRPLRERAEDVVASTRRPQPNLGPGPLGTHHG